MADFPFQIVGFDLDGTLLDTQADLGAAVNHALSLIARPPVPPEIVRDLIGGGAKMMLERALRLTGGIPDSGFDDLYHALLTYYERHIAVFTRLFDGGLVMLDALTAQRVQLAVVTNKFESLARQVLDELGLTHYFYTVIGGDTLGKGRAKPAPDQLFEMIARAPITGRAAYVGDTTFDTMAAKNAQIPCIAVRFGFNDKPAEELGADAIIDHFDALLPALLTL
ncbi:MAG: hypothetical protein RLY97_341 [Pseudomonadota bacterium]